MNKTGIEWAEYSWNPITGCSKISSGCENCYAERMANRLRGRCGYPDEEPFQVTWHPRRLMEPMKLKKPSTIFVCSMGDIFHPLLRRSAIDEIWRVMADCPQHRFLILTKRADLISESLYKPTEYEPLRFLGGGEYLPNVWLGVSVENQEMADQRIPFLLRVPAAGHFVSYEPALGPVDLGLKFAGVPAATWWPGGEKTPAGPYPWESRWVRVSHTVCGGWGMGGICPPGIYRAESNKHGALCVMTSKGWLGLKPSEFEVLPGLDWVIAGGESGPGARPAHPDWFRSVRYQCRAAGVPFLFKQWGAFRDLNDTEIDPNDFPLYECQKVHSCGRRLRYSLHGGFTGIDEMNGWRLMVREGKKSAGRLLDGREWNEYPWEDKS